GLWPLLFAASLGERCPHHACAATQASGGRFRGSVLSSAARKNFRRLKPLRRPCDRRAKPTGPSRRSPCWRGTLSKQTGLRRPVLAGESLLCVSACGLIVSWRRTVLAGRYRLSEGRDLILPLRKFEPPAPVTSAVSPPVAGSRTDGLPGYIGGKPEAATVPVD